MFGELHVYFSDIDVAFGPQLQIPIAEITRVQLRAGVGAGPDTSPYALAGVQLAHVFIGGTLSARRSFETGEVAVSFDVEIQPLMWLLVALLRD